MKNNFLALITSMIISTPAFALDFRGSFGVESRYFTEADDIQTSCFIEPELYWQNEDGSSAVTFKPFSRWDRQDTERSHLDIRELFYQFANDHFEFRLGINKIYWGVTESQHLVDVINQTDFLEGFDGEDKLGQPMSQLTFIHDWGVIDIFALPYFRERDYAGKDGHFNFKIQSGSQIYAVNFNDAVYESKDKEKHLDTAIRYSHTWGDWDFGLSYFDGTQRSPYFIFNNFDPLSTEFSVTPFYVQMQQVGIDLQATLGSWLWKAELISRNVLDQHFTAVTAGFEYTFYGVSESGGDWGILVEFNQNDDQDLSQSAAQNDAFVGARYTWNDEQSSELLFGISQDLENSNSYAAKIEASRRLGENYKITLDSWFFNSNNTADPLFNIKNEDFVQLTLEYYF